MEDISVEERTSEGRPTVALSGQLNITTAPGVRRVLMKHVRGEGPELLVDLSGLEFMDTSGLATLIETHIKCEEHGGRLVLFGLQPLISEVFDVTRVSDLFSIHPTEQQALDALEGEGQ
jgi:anti-sigma B factor antagonist